MIQWTDILYSSLAFSSLLQDGSCSSKKSHPGSRQEKGCYRQQTSLVEGSESFPKITQQTSVHDSLIITGLQGYPTLKQGWKANHFALPDSPVELGWEEGG